MTRLSRRELESAIEDLNGRESCPEQWVYEFLERRFEEGFELDFSSSENGYGDAVCILDTEQFMYFVPREDVPERLDSDADLPVEGGIG